jgi:hypothetical protein
MNEIRLLVGDARLRAALAGVLGGSVSAAQQDGELAAGPGVIVTTVHDTSPADCREFSGDGHVVIVLVALPSGIEENAYRDAGAAAYLAMAGSRDGLLAAVHDALSGLSAGARRRAQVGSSPIEAPVRRRQSAM